MKKILLPLLFATIFSSSIFAQSNFWNKNNNQTFVESAKLARETQVKEFLIYDLDLATIKTKLAMSPTRSATAVSNVILSFPNSQGEMQSFKMYEASTLESQIAAANPQIQTYVGKCIEDPTATITITTTIFGFHAITHSGLNGTTYIDPYTKDLQSYIVYNKSNTSNSRIRSCGVKANLVSNEPEDNQNFQRANNSVFKTYRLAMACTYEYGRFQYLAANFTDASTNYAGKKAAVLAAIVITVARVNSVYEKDNSLTMVLINNNTDIINVQPIPVSTTANPTIPLDDTNTDDALLNNIQAYIDGKITFENYDIGHVASTGGGGVANLGCVCTPNKARGVTGSPAPVGDPYDIDYVAHEMGHQFGGEHTFNSESNSCGGGNRTPSSSYEPGSGTTIQAYAGICSPDNIQGNSDAYFHTRSLVQIFNQINGATTNCAAAQPSGNTPPVITAMPTSLLPIGTAFALTAVATDADNPSGNQLTYCWEQFDFGSASVLPNATKTSGPNFRSFSPAVSPTRYFPEITKVLAGNLVTAWEAIPNVGRNMRFSVIVRDNGGPLGGQTERATKLIQFVAAAGPFKVTSQAALEGWAQNSQQIVTWDVAGTNANGINTANVNIKISIDGGTTFTMLLANTPNDGSAMVTAPNVVSQTCRILVEAVGNIYYAINKFPFYIGYSVSNSCTNYTGNTTADNVFPFSLADGATTLTIKKFIVPATNVNDVNLTLNITHPNLQNLKVDLLKPASPLLSIYNQQCPGNANMNIEFDSQSPTFACTNPTSGTYALPVGTLNELNGATAAGLWQIGFRDMVVGEVGTVNSIDLEICSLTVSLLGSENFNFENFGLYPNPNNGQFNLKFDSTSNNNISVNICDIQGRSVFEKSFVSTGLFNENIEFSNTQKGIYLVKIKDGEKQIVKKIVVE